LTVHGGLKWLCEQNHTVFITRDRRGSVAAQVEQVRAALGGHPLTIFPEGTTSDGTAMLPFKSSLLSAVEPLAHAVPVQPVALDYADAPGIAWFGNEHGMANVRRILARPGRIELTIRFLEPLAGEELADRKAMTASAQAAIAGALRLLNRPADGVSAPPHATVPRPRDLQGQELRLPDERLRRRAHGRAARRPGHARRARGRGRRPRRAQHLPHPREGGREGLFGHRSGW
jgi:hypothetical protein